MPVIQISVLGVSIFLLPAIVVIPFRYEGMYFWLFIGVGRERDTRERS